MKKITYILISVVAIMMLCGCWSGYQISTSPSGAKVLVKGENQGQTPVDVYLYKGGEETLVIEKEGYKKIEAKVYPRIRRDLNRMHFDLEQTEQEIITAGQTLIELIDTATGVKIQSEKVHAEKEVIERSPNVTAVRRVTDLSSNRWVGNFTLSRDGATILVEILDQENAERKINTFSNIWSLNAYTSGGIRRVTQGNYFDRHPCISPDGEYVYFSSNRTGRHTIWRLSMKTLGGLGLVTSGATSDSLPELSPDGKNLLYTAHMIGSDIPQIWTIPIGRGLPTQLREGSNAQWSKDGQRILFSAQDRTTAMEKIWTMALDGSSPTQITSGSDKNDIHPRWSPDGSKIIFASDRGIAGGKANYDIWIMNADGSELKQLTTNGSRDDLPVFSPDGKSIYFRSNRGIKWDIWVMKLAE